MSKATLRQLIYLRKKIREEVEDSMREVREGATTVTYHISGGEQILQSEVTSTDFEENQNVLAVHLKRLGELETLINRLNNTQFKMKVLGTETTVSIIVAIDMLRRQREYLNVLGDLLRTEEKEIDSDYSSSNVTVKENNLDLAKLRVEYGQLAKEVEHYSQAIDKVTATLKSDIEIDYLEDYILVTE